MLNLLNKKKKKAKPWNWKTVSRHKTFLPTIELLKLTKDFELDWQTLITTFKFKSNQRTLQNLKINGIGKALRKSANQFF